MKLAIFPRSAIEAPLYPLTYADVGKCESVRNFVSMG